MTNLEKMCELVREKPEKTTKRKVIDWAYMNRITVDVLHFDEGISEMENSFNDYYQSGLYQDDGFGDWERFLDREFVE